MNFVTRNKTHLLFLSGLILSIFFYLFVYFIGKYNNPEQITKRFQRNFLEQQSLLNDKISKVITILAGEETQFWPKLERLLNENQIYTQIYRNDSLLFWNNSRIPNNFIDAESNNSEAIKYYPTGWFLSVYIGFEGLEVCLFKEIK